MKQTAIENLNKQIIREITDCLNTYSTKQEIEVEQRPYKLKFEGMRATKLLQKLKDSRKERHEASFSPNTYNIYMPALTKAGWVKRHTVSHKKVFYELDNEKMKEMEKALQCLNVSGVTLEELGRLANNLIHYNQEPFFGLIETGREKEKVKKLIFIRDTCRKIANQLDLLHLPEVEA